MNYYHQPPQNLNPIVININTPTCTPPQPSHFTYHMNSNYPSAGYSNLVSPSPNPPQANSTLESLMNDSALVGLLTKKVSHAFSKENKD